jgi:hypothetical protein
MTFSVHSERRSTLALFIAPAAIAGAGALLALRLYFQPPTVPPYALVGTSDAAVLRPSGHFDMDIHPAVPVIGAVAARAFLLRGSEVRPWDPPFEVARDGSIRLTGGVSALFAGVPAGEWEIAVAVGRPETLPTAPNDILRRRDESADAGTAAWRLVRERIHLGS